MYDTLVSLSEIRCPFCSKSVYTHASPIESDGMSEEEVETLLEDGSLCWLDVGPDVGPHYCEHVAFFGAWGYDDGTIPSGYAALMEKLGQDLGIESGPREITSGLMRALMDAYDAGELPQIDARIRKALPSFEVATLGEFMPDGSGLKGTGGPTYLGIFVKEAGS